MTGAAMQVERAAYEPPHAPAGSQKGGQFTNTGGSQGEHSGSRPGDQPAASSGTSSTGTKPKPTAKGTPKPPVKPIRGGPMGRGAKGKQVRQLQALLGALGIDPGGLDGAYGPKTEAAVKAAQKKLGLKTTGRADGQLMKALSAAEALSPCIKRSDDFGDLDLLRAQIERGDFDEEEGGEVLRSSEIMRYERSWPLEGIEIIRGGDGRTVEAYAAVFDTPAEVRDQHGHYIEDIDPTAFGRELKRAMPQGGRDHWLTKVFYNHGTDLYGQPSALGSVPLGSPVDIRADHKGLLTVTRYNKTDLADAVLEAIRAGDIRAQSFRGRIYRSTPDKVPGRRASGLPSIRRMELGLTEYGPTPSAVYSDAAILAVRATQVAHSLADLDARERAELIRMLQTGAPLGDSPSDAVASALELDAGDSLDERSARLAIRRSYLRAEAILQGVI